MSRMKGTDTGARFSPDAFNYLGKVNFNDSGTVSGYAGPNVQYTVPEPGAVGLLGVGGLALAARRRRPGA